MRSQPRRFPRAALAGRPAGEATPTAVEGGGHGSAVEPNRTRERSAGAASLRVGPGRH